MLDLEEGFTDVYEDEVPSDRPPPGRYQLLSPKSGVGANPLSGLPVFLLDSLLPSRRPGWRPSLPTAQSIRLPSV